MTTPFQHPKSFSSTPPSVPHPLSSTPKSITQKTSNLVVQVFLFRFVFLRNDRSLKSVRFLFYRNLNIFSLKIQNRNLIVRKLYIKMWQIDHYGFKILKFEGFLVLNWGILGAEKEWPFCVELRVFMTRLISAKITPFWEAKFRTFAYKCATRP